MSEQGGERARWAQVGATVFVGLVGLVFTGVQFIMEQDSQRTQFELQERNRKAQVALQLMSQREVSEMNFRQDMFDVLIAQLLDPKVPVDERTARLQLFLHNFHDIFNARALFDVLEEEARRLPQPDRDSLIGELVSMAKEVRRAQELLVGATPQVFDMKEGESVTVRLQIEHDQGDHEDHDEGHIRMASNGNGGSHEIGLRLVEVRKHAVDVEIIMDPSLPGARSIPFEVSYFDAPLTDNTLFPDKHRFAVTLQETDIEGHPHTATIRMFEFPAHFVTTGYRPTLRESNEMIENLD